MKFILIRNLRNKLRVASNFLERCPLAINENQRLGKILRVCAKSRRGSDHCMLRRCNLTHTVLRLGKILVLTTVKHFNSTPRRSTPKISVFLSSDVLILANTLSAAFYSTDH